MSYLTYILYSPDFNKYYVGYTPDMERRLYEHNVLSLTSYTSKYRPWVLFASISFEHKTSAIKAEKYLKKKPREFLQRLQNDQDLIDTSKQNLIPVRALPLYSGINP